MLLGRDAIAALIPHGGIMCLLDGVVSWDAQRIRCRATSHTATGHPLAVGGVLPMVCGLEYAAQAMAVHGRLTGAVGTRPRIGYIASVRNLTWRGDRLDLLPAPLVIDAEQLAADGSTVLYRFSVEASDDVVLTGRAALLLEGGMA